ncbi:MAG TPA: molybdenum cofactor biosynthesis protein MoaE [Acidimicrobiales bacterium]|nr:molybdenum cofactor biosynthesis protein MoaE [Acidimicrobiales bacterium]
MTPAAPTDRVSGPEADDWVALVHGPLPVDAAGAWAVRPDCGAVVSFSGTARDHAGDRRGVTSLEYEAYEEQALPRMAAIVAAARGRWPEIGRVAIVHRLGAVPVGESAVVVVVAAPHRGEAFDAARFAIDALKATVPIWKNERWDGGASWGVDAQHVTGLDEWIRSVAAPSAVGRA